MTNMHYLQFIFSILVIIIYLIIIVLLIKAFINGIIYKVPQVGTFSSDFKVMKKNLGKYKLKGKKLADLGSGSGKALRFFEKEFQMKVTGYEIDLFNVMISKVLKYLYTNKAEIIKGNYLKADLSSYDVIYIYGFTVLMPGIEKKVWDNCKKGTLVISNAFKMPNKKAIDILLSDEGKEELYIYKV